MSQWQFDSLLGKLGPLLSELVHASTYLTEESNKKTLKHHTEQMLDVCQKILKNLGCITMADVQELKASLSNDSYDDCTRLDGIGKPGDLANHLAWIYCRLRRTHHELRDVDYMRRLYDVIREVAAMKKEIETVGKRPTHVSKQCQYAVTQFDANDDKIFRLWFGTLQDIKAWIKEKQKEKSRAFQATLPPYNVTATAKQSAETHEKLWGVSKLQDAFDDKLLKDACAQVEKNAVDAFVAGGLGASVMSQAAKLVSEHNVKNLLTTIATGLMKHNEIRRVGVFAIDHYLSISYRNAIGKEEEYRLQFEKGFEKKFADSLDCGKLLVEATEYCFHLLTTRCKCCQGILVNSKNGFCGECLSKAL